MEILGFFDEKKAYIEVFLRLQHVKVKLREWRENNEYKYRARIMEPEELNSQD